MIPALPQLNCDRYWQTALRYFDSLPVDLFKQYMLVSHNLSMQLSGTGQFQDILRRSQDYPLLDQYFWLINDWDVEEKPAFCDNLFLAVLLQFLANKIEHDVQDETTFIGAAGFGALQRAFEAESLVRWKNIFPPSSMFWEDHSNIRKMDTWQLGALSLKAVAVYYERTADLPRLFSMNGHFTSVFQAIENFSTLMADVKQGRRTPLIQRALEATSATDARTISGEFVMGALLLTGALKKIVQECHEHLNSAEIIAQELNLPHFQRHCIETRSTLDHAHHLLSMRGNSDHISLKNFFTPPLDLLPEATAKAQEYLLAEPSFREAWEVQQYISPKMPVLIGRPFPAAMILETLCKHGIDMSAQVDEILDLYIQNGFGYYTEPGWTPPDADDLALAIRISRYSLRPEYIKQQLQIPLQWMRRSQKDSGQIPVWFMENDFPIPLNPLSICYGGECATVEANLMIALTDSHWLEQKDIVESCAHSWCDRWLSIGLGSTGHYNPLFSLWTNLELTAKISRLSEDPALLNKLDAVTALSLERLNLQARRADLTPQDASFLALASLCASDSRLPFDVNWLTVLFKSQKGDGSWDGEPIYIIPTGRWLSVNWLASRAVTTAFCFHALRSYQASLER